MCLYAVSTATITAPVSFADGVTPVITVPASTTTMASSTTTADGDAPATSLPGLNKGICSKQRRGYHTPYKARRPQRLEKLQSAKAIARNPCINSREPPLPEQVQQVRQIASVLQYLSQCKASTSRRFLDSVEVLMEVADVMQPKQTKRTSRHLDDILLSGREFPGARHNYRMSQLYNGNCPFCKAYLGF